MDNPQEPQPDPLERLWQEGFIKFYDEDILSRGKWTKEQLDELWGHLRAPIVREYLKEVGHTAMRELARLDFTRPEDQLKLAAKHGYCKGALALVENIITSTTERK